MRLATLHCVAMFAGLTAFFWNPTAIPAQQLCCQQTGLACTTNGDCSGPGDPCVACPTDHLKCYRVRDPLRLKGTSPQVPWLDLLGPQFGMEHCKIQSAFRLFCVPVAKRVTGPIFRKFVPPGGPWVPFTPTPLPAAQEIVQDQLCYKIRCDPTVLPDRSVTDQFATRDISNFQPFLLCGPAVKNPLPTTTTTTSSTTSTTAPCQNQASYPLSTGPSGILTGSDDPRWELNAEPGGTCCPPGATCGGCSTPRPATVIQTSTFSPWSVQSFSQWISANTACCGDSGCTGALAPECPGGDYRYRTCWHTACPCDVMFNLLVDNTADVFLDGAQLPGGPVGFTTPTSFSGSCAAGTSHVLEVVVHNGSAGPTICSGQNASCTGSGSPWSCCTGVGTGTCCGTSTGMDLQGFIDGSTVTGIGACP